MNKIKHDLTNLLPLFLLVLMAAACNSIPQLKDLSDNPMGGNSDKGNYLLLQRARIIDEMGFDKPVEAGSVLIPEGWTMSGGVRWKGINECRGDIIQQEIKITSPDGEIEFTSYPSRTFVYAEDEMMMESLKIGAQNGGCQISPPFDASEYVVKFAADELNASAYNIKTDDAKEQMLREMNEKAYSSNAKYGLKMDNSTTVVQSDLKFTDGKVGVAYVGVSAITSYHPNYLSGGSVTSNTTAVFFNAVVKFPADRKKEALEIVDLINTSSRTNPIWTQAKTDFLTKLGNIEHAGRMERIRLVGEQSRAYARSRDQAMDEQMRSWERQQDSSDASHRRFVKTIREVDTWKDSSGDNVDLNSGYKYGWSKPDGSYILTDNPNFDPAIKFNQNWKKMDKMPD